MMVNENRNFEVDEAEFRHVLAHASAPDMPSGMSERLLAELGGGPVAGRVVAFRPRPRNVFRYLAALPLAASLAAGVYLGAMGTLDSLLPQSVTGAVADNGDTVDDLGGVTDAEDYVEENLT